MPQRLRCFSSNVVKSTAPSERHQRWPQALQIGFGKRLTWSALRWKTRKGPRMSSVIKKGERYLLLALQEYNLQMPTPEERRLRQLESDIIGSLREIGSSLRSLLEVRKKEQEHSAAERQAATQENDILKSSDALRDVTYRLEALAREIDSEQEKRERRQFQNRSLAVQWCLFAATFLAFGAAAWYAWVATQQKLAMEGQLTAMNNSFGEIQKQTSPIIDSARAAATGAAAAKNSANVTRDSLLIVQRAFVTFAQNLTVNAVTDEADRQKVVRWEFSPVMSNSGNTPTRHAMQVFNAKYGPPPLPDGFIFNDADIPVGMAPLPFVLAPKDTKVGATLPIDASVLQNVRDGTSHLYFFGWVTYDDIFKNHHISMLCKELMNVRGSPTSLNVPLSWRQCIGPGTRHNCSDDECDGEHYGRGQIWHSR
jgi:hypothetical protein